MSDRTTMKAGPSTLVEGQRLDQPTFHALYEVMPPGTRAELIDEWFICPALWPCPRPCPCPGDCVARLLCGAYSRGGTGQRYHHFGWKSEPQPDALLCPPECGGRTTEEGYFHGAPELVVEVSKATRYIDLGPKKAEYERAGALEYVVRAIEPDEIFWFRQEQGVLVPRPLGDDGLYRSTVFPGLWLDPAALTKGDQRRLRAVVDWAALRRNMLRSSPGWPSPCPVLITPGPQPARSHSGGVPWPIEGQEHDGATPSIQRRSQCRSSPEPRRLPSRPGEPHQEGRYEVQQARRAGLG